MSGVIEKFKGWLLAEEEDEEEVVISNGNGDDRPKRRSLLSLHAARAEEIYLRRPRSLEEAQACADYLKSRRPVVVNLKSLDEGKARRVLDFLGGVIYAVDGHMEEAGEGIYLLTPNTVAIDAEAQAVSRDEGVFWGE